jgi:hypothetical protein
MINKEIQDALNNTAEAIQADVVDKAVMPFDVGTLQDSLFVDDSMLGFGKATIVASTPYARRLYYHPEYNFQTKNNRYAGGKYFEPWTSEGKYARWVLNRFGEFMKGRF